MRFRVVELERSGPDEPRAFIVIDTDKDCRIIATCSDRSKAQGVAVALEATPLKEEPF